MWKILLYVSQTHALYGWFLNWFQLISRYDHGMEKTKPLAFTLEEFAGLTQSQQSWINAILYQFKLNHTFVRKEDSDLVTETVLQNIGDLLRIHHAMSRRSPSKAPFEYAFEKALQLSGQPAKIADSATNPGYDLTIGATRISLKTEAAKNISESKIHVSKWMEMGKGEWDPTNKQLPRFIEHMGGYDRILTLRCLKQSGSYYEYELVEIPKALMLEAAVGVMESAISTTQASTPWYCRVLDKKSTEEALADYSTMLRKPKNPPKPIYKFSLYFDAGTERKLQVKGLLKSHCVVHATWKFDSVQLVASDVDEDEDEKLAVKNGDLFS